MPLAGIDVVPHDALFNAAVVVPMAVLWSHPTVLH